MHKNLLAKKLNNNSEFKRLIKMTSKLSVTATKKNIYIRIYIYILIFFIQIKYWDTFIQIIVEDVHG